MAYLWRRVIAAWGRGDDEEAFILNRMHESMEAMTEDEYKEKYPAT